MQQKLESSSNKGVLALMLGAIGVVYGDIGTSPLYALESCFAITKMPVIEENIIGIISLFLWTLIIIVYLKYITIVMRCDQHGEGGVLILSSICKQISGKHIKKISAFLGILGLSLFMGDSVITPAISVLSACEGLKLVTNLPEHSIVNIALVILILLFKLQSQGSGNIGRYFGYIMLIWFIALSLLGINSILKNPAILSALNPYHAIKFIIDNKLIGFITLGGGILVVSGVEALYADMGHFGKTPIRLSWNCVVSPALILNYLGQGALLLRKPEAIDHVFYNLTPSYLMYPMIVLSILATIIASQAVISGLFSLAHQAIMLNYLPRMTIKHTSFYHIGQIYLPAINYILFILTASAVIIFKSSSNLSFAYGLSVASVMMLTTILTCIVAYFKWKWSLLKTAIIFIPLLSLDCLFVSSNLNKIFEGAWYTIAIAVIAMYIMHVWQKGNAALKKQRTISSSNIIEFLEKELTKQTIRIPGCAIFFTRELNKVPGTLVVNLKHNKYLHEKILFVSIITKDKAKVHTSKRFEYQEIFQNIYLINANFGFYETPDLNKLISWTEEQKILKPTEEISCFLSQGLPVIDSRYYLNKFSEKLYIFMSRNALPAYEFFKIDPNKLIELGVMYKV